MNDYKKLMMESKEKLDQRLAIKKKEAIRKAETFFKENKSELVNATLDNIIKDMENRTSTKFEYIYECNNDIRYECECFKDKYRAHLSYLIENCLSELSTDFCVYNVKIEEGEDVFMADKIFIEITLEIK